MKTDNNLESINLEKFSLDKYEMSFVKGGELSYTYSRTEVGCETLSDRTTTDICIVFR